ncbi:hypothetical protein PG984_005071 [Apiospora sp. TS-2023a]
MARRNREVKTKAKGKANADTDEHEAGCHPFTVLDPSNAQLNSDQSNAHHTKHQPPHARKTRSRKSMVPMGQNCSLFLTGIPAELDVTRFMAQGAEVQIGKVAALHLHQSEPGQRHKAAEITMWTRAEAERLMLLILNREFTFGINRPLRAFWNRRRVGSQTLDGSRVVEVTGRAEHVDPNVLIPRFQQEFRFDLDQVVVKMRGPNWTVVEYRFGSYTDQA